MEKMNGSATATVKQQQQQDNEKIYTPSIIWDAVRNRAVELLKEAKTQIVTVAGILIGKHDAKAYNNYVYLSLKDEYDSMITLRVHESMYGEIMQYNGKQIKLQGIFYISVYPQLNKIDVVFGVYKILGSFTSEKVDKAQMERANKIQTIFNKKSKRNHDVRNLLMQILNKNQKPSVVFIMGSTGIVDKDVISAMKGTDEYYDIKIVRTNLTDKESILSAAFQAIKENNCDALCIIRGGGDGLQVFNDPDFVLQILEIDKPLVSAVGHAQDTPLFEQAADQKFETPTALGVFLREIAENYRFSHRAKELEEKVQQLMTQNMNAMATIKEIQQAKDTISQEIQKLQQERDKFKQALMLAGILVGVLVILLVLIIFHSK